MAYDEDLADRLRDVIAARENVSERKMFGGLALMINGNMACGLMNDGRMMIRVAKDEFEEVLTDPHAHEMEFTGRKMTGFVVIDEAGFASDEDLAGWVDLGADYAASLPAKKPKK